MRVAVTGATGVLGRHFLAQVRRADECPEVQGVVALSRAEAPHDAGVATVRTDYSVEHLSEVFEGCDAVVHLAASRSASADLEAHLPSLQVADAVFTAAAGRVGQVVYASSISVYGTGEPRPWTEDTVPAAQLPYGVLKFTAERLGAGRLRASGTAMTSLRLGHLYGAGEINAYLVNTFMRQAAEGEDLHLHAPARARRDFTYAGDAAHGILDALRAGVTGVFNIGSGAPATNAEIAQAVVAGFDSPSRIVIDDPSASEGIAETGMDLTASARVLGYRPRHTHVEAFQEIAAMLNHTRTRHA